MATPKIIYTLTDEAPALATKSFLPIVETFVRAAGISVETRDISLAGRIISAFPELLNEDQRIDDDLAKLGELAKSPEANIIKLPNISASVPQLIATIEELQAKGYGIPDYPEEPENDAEKAIKFRYNKLKGSAVNPVLREGNSDRRAPKAVKQYARMNPHSMGAWSSDSKTHVVTMGQNDFRSNEKSTALASADTVKIEFVDTNGSATTLKDNLSLLAGEIIDSSVLNKKALLAFLESEIADAKDQGVLMSLHMKATMMKVSDPIIFGHAVSVFFKSVFDRHATVLDEIGVDVRNGFGDLVAKIEELPADKQAEINADIKACYENGPDLAMVNSDKGITNLHVPSDVII
ncbi:MAG: NADP-dependent isocitrate dehydrogenase, partial [Crocinitomicaceae bacterium]|nr:NADP-dependent isocitrate dehydrogenase [Crocinitomicaceae bacterium]